MKQHLILALTGSLAVLPLTAEEATQNSTTEKNQPMTPETPADVAAAPADAEKTNSGLASKVLKKGTGTKKPGPRDTVTVHYSGWTTDGELFDSSVKRGEPTSFPLNQVIKGWTEGLQLMVTGEKRRFWIPAELAYGETPSRPGAPAGMLVFDVELLDVAEAPKPPEDTEKTASGIAYKVTKAGTGEEHPSSNDIVTFHFTAKTTAGETVQDTHAQGEAPSAPINKLPPEMNENLSAMVAGETRKVWIPESRVPGGFIVADIELISFKAAPEPPAVPENVGSVPETAEKTDSGLASEVLVKGSGDTHPTAESTVTVHYTGWETNGEMFDSSVTRGEPTSFPLNQVIAGWTEGVQLMVVGEKRRFWIPEDLAYGPKIEGSGRPGGMLVFDVELLEIK